MHVMQCRIRIELINTCLTDWLAFGNGSGNDAFDTSEQVLGNKDVLCLSKKTTLKSHSGSESLFLMRPKEFVAGNKESFPSVISDEEEGMQSQPE